MQTRKKSVKKAQSASNATEQEEKINPSFKFIISAEIALLREEAVPEVQIRRHPNYEPERDFDFLYQKMCIDLSEIPKLINQLQEFQKIYSC